ncbi:MAG TPA: hypothetical protein VF113_02260 [Stellaceae bacterium]
MCGRSLPAQQQVARYPMLYRNFPIRSFVALAIGLGGCAAYGPSAGYPTSPYGYYDGYGYPYPPGYAYAPGFFGSSLDFGVDRRFDRHHEERRREPERARADHRGHGPAAHPPGPVHVAPGGRGAALSGRTSPRHTAPQGHGTAQKGNDGDHGRPRP